MRMYHLGHLIPCRNNDRVGVSVTLVSLEACCRHMRNFAEQQCTSTMQQHAMHSMICT
jgi:hypothetical protein